MILFVLTEVEVILAKLTSEIKKFNSMKSSSFLESTQVNWSKYINRIYRKCLLIFYPKYLVKQVL